MCELLEALVTAALVGDEALHGIGFRYVPASDGNPKGRLTGRLPRTIGESKANLVVQRSFEIKELNHI